MTTTYTDLSKTYIFENTVNGEIDITFNNINGTGYTDDDLDAAVKAMVDSLNTTGRGQITSVTKNTGSMGTTDFTYTPTLPDAPA